MQKLLDWSKAVSLHVLYGHDHFLREAKAAQKNQIFINNVCTNSRCKVLKQAKAIC